MNIRTPSSDFPLITFVGGGNMASAIIGGLLHEGHPASALQVIEPWEEQRTRLSAQFPGVDLLAAASADMKPSDMVIWAVKPQTFREAALATAAHVPGALHLSVAAGITTDSMTAWLGSGRIVRAMPNTPALVGMGMTGLFARDDAGDDDRALVEQVVRTTGELAWVPVEHDLDAVTALSGSGPAYVFYFLEAMRDAGESMACRPSWRCSWPPAPSSAQPRWPSGPTIRRRSCASGSPPRVAPPMPPSPRCRRPR